MSVLQSNKPSAPANGETRNHSILRRFNPSALVTLVGVLIVWAIASSFTSSQIIPTIPEVAEALREIVTAPEQLRDLFTTLARVGAGMAASFVLGTCLGLLTGTSVHVAAYLLPLIRFIQGIPSLSWVVLAVIWFEQVELRVWFVMLMVTLPGFLLQVHDSYRAIPADLRDMARSFRPGRFALFRELTLPAITPGIFTAWKVNLGLGIRVVLIAELVGATVGVGAQLLSAQQLFNMTAVVAWTILLALSVLVIQGIIELIETRALRYRPSPEARQRAGTEAKDSE